MSKGFTWQEAAIVVAVLAVPVMLALHPLARRRRAMGMLRARKAPCKSNLYNIGLALRSFRSDHGDRWPAFYMPEDPDNPNINAWGRLLAGQYLDDLAAFCSPAAGYEPRLETCWSGQGSRAGEAPCVLYASYGYDNGRIRKNVNPGRAVAAANMETSLGPQEGQRRGDAVGRHVDRLYEDGTHVLMADVSAVWIDLDFASRYWVPHQGLSPRHPMAAGGAPSYEEGAWGPAWAHYPVSDAAQRYDFVRQGVVMNPRINEDRHRNLTPDDSPRADLFEGEQRSPGRQEDFPAPDLDDVFCIEADTPVQGRLPGEWQARTGWSMLDKDGGEVAGELPEHGRRVAVSRIDAAIVPTMGFRAGMGWPDGIYPVGGDQTPRTVPADWASALKPRPVPPGLAIERSRMWPWIAAGAAAVVLATLAAAWRLRRKPSARRP